MAPDGSVLSLMQFVIHKVQCKQVQTLVCALCWETSLMCIGFGYMKKKRNSRGEGFILAWKSGINSNVSTLWSKEAPRKSSFWSTSQSWSWDLQNQLELNEFARTLLEGLEQGMLRSGGSSLGLCLQQGSRGPCSSKSQNSADQKTWDAPRHLGGGGWCPAVGTSGAQVSWWWSPSTKRRQKLLCSRL